MNTIAQQSTKQILNEPFELLKTAKRQMSGSEFYLPAEKPILRKEDSPSEEQKALEGKVNQTDTRRLQALESEMRDIRRQRIFNELQRKIQEGQEVFLNDITELSHEQKDVLKAQMETIESQKLKVKGQKSLVEPAPRKSRRLFAFGQKEKAESLKTRVERPLPPSG